MSKKYQLLKNDTIQAEGQTLYRIQALRDIPNVAKREALGGYVASESNLSHKGKCWVGGEAKVCDKAQVCDNAQVYGNARILNNARVSGNAEVSDEASIGDNAQVSGNARVSGNAMVYGHAQVSDNALVSGDARVSDNAQVSENASICDDAEVSDNAHVSGNAMVYGHAQVSGNAVVFGDAKFIDESDSEAHDENNSVDEDTMHIQQEIKMVVTERNVDKKNSLPTLDITKSKIDIIHGSFHDKSSLMNSTGHLELKLFSIKFAASDVDRVTFAYDENPLVRSMVARTAKNIETKKIFMHDPDPNVRLSAVSSCSNDEELMLFANDRSSNVIQMIFDNLKNNDLYAYFLRLRTENTPNENSIIANFPALRKKTNFNTVTQLPQHLRLEAVNKVNNVQLLDVVFDDSDIIIATRSIERQNDPWFLLSRLFLLTGSHRQTCDILKRVYALLSNDTDIFFQEEMQIFFEDLSDAKKRIEKILTLLTSDTEKLNQYFREDKRFFENFVFAHLLPENSPEFSELQKKNFRLVNNTCILKITDENLICQFLNNDDYDLIRTLLMKIKSQSLLYSIYEDETYNETVRKMALHLFVSRQNYMQKISALIEQDVHRQFLQFKVEMEVKEAQAKYIKAQEIVEKQRALVDKTISDNIYAQTVEASE